MSLTVAIRQKVSDIKILLRPLNGVIAGRVTDVLGNPIVNVRVVAQTALYDNGRRTFGLKGSAFTSDRGEFRIHSLPMGSYFVRTLFAATSDSVNLDTFFPGVTSPDQAEKVVVYQDRPTQIVNFVNQTSRSGVFSGKIVFPPQFGGDCCLKIYLLRRDESVLGEETDYEVKLNKDGTFEGNRPIAPGSYHVFAWLRDAPTFGPLVTSFGLVLESQRLSDPQVAYFGEVDIEVSSGRRAENITIPLQPASDTQGRIVFDTGVAANSSESLRVYLHPLYGKQGTSVPLGIFSGFRLPLLPDSNGIFSASKLPSGQYGIRVEGLREDAYIADVVQNQRSAYEHGITVVSGMPTHIDVHIRSKGATIKGIVKEASGALVPYASVILVPTNKARRNSMFYRAARTDTTGSFSIRGIVPDEYMLLAWREDPNGAYDLPAFFARYEGLSTTVKAVNEAVTEGVQVHLLVDTDTQ